MSASRDNVFEIALKADRRIGLPPIRGSSGVGGCLWSVAGNCAGFGGHSSQWPQSNCRKRRCKNPAARAPFAAKGFMSCLLPWETKTKVEKKPRKLRNPNRNPNRDAGTKCLRHSLRNSRPPGEQGGEEAEASGIWNGRVAGPRSQDRGTIASFARMCQAVASLLARPGRA